MCSKQQQQSSKALLLCQGLVLRAHSLYHECIVGQAAAADEQLRQATKARKEYAYAVLAAVVAAAWFAA